MKRVTLLFMLVFVASVAANAQIGFGIKGGLNFANSDIKNAAEDPSSKTGYHVGLFLEAGVGGFAIQPELLYSFKGAEDFDLSYIEVPVLFKKNFAKVLNIHLGPQFGFLASADNPEFEAALAASGQSGELKDFMKSTEVSAVIGAGVNAPFGLTGGIRYVFGLSDVWDGSSVIDTEITNKTLQIFVGYKFAGN